MHVSARVLFTVCVAGTKKTIKNKKMQRHDACLLASMLFFCTASMSEICMRLSFICSVILKTQYANVMYFYELSDVVSENYCVDPNDMHKKREKSRNSK